MTENPLSASFYLRKALTEGSPQLTVPIRDTREDAARILNKLSRDTVCVFLGIEKPKQEVSEMQTESWKLELFSTL